MVSAWSTPSGHLARPIRRTPLALVVAMIAAFSVVGAAPARAVDPTDARDFIARVIDAHGGWTRLQGVKAYRVEGTLFSVRRHDESPTVRVSAGPSRLKVLIDYEDGHEARLFDGRLGWRATGGGEFEPSAGPMLDAIVLQAARAAVPWILHGREADARLIEPYATDSTRWPGIELPLDGGLMLRVYADPGTWRMRMSQGLLSHGGMQTRFETYYEDWRAVEGVWFAFQEQNWASGVHTGATAIRTVILNPKLSNGEFVPPRPSGPPKAPARRSS